jgi:magnesium-transporting ATPase (P-type)
VESENSSDSLKVKILKHYEFVPELRRMSVVVQSNGRGLNLVNFVFCKGAPEDLMQLCVTGNEFPEDG